jgi:hypothetical protein
MKHFSVESIISMLRREKVIPFPHRKAFSGLPCKAPTSNDMKSAGGVPTLTLENGTFMTSITFYENEEYPKGERGTLFESERVS